MYLFIVVFLVALLAMALWNWRLLRRSPDAEPPGAGDSRALWLLAVAPVQWFRHHFHALALPVLLALAWGMGTLKAIDYTDAQVFKKHVGLEYNVWPPAFESWTGWLVWVLALGAVAALVVWFIGYWWYRVRLRLSGARGVVDPRRLRSLYFLSEVWVMIPVAIWIAIAMLRYPDMNAAWSGDGGAFTALLALTYLLSLLISSFAVATVYPVGRKRAFFWFFLFPLFPVYFDLISIFARL